MGWGPPPQHTGCGGSLYFQGPNAVAEWVGLTPLTQCWRVVRETVVLHALKLQFDNPPKEQNAHIFIFLFNISKFLNVIKSIYHIQWLIYSFLSNW